MQEDKAIGQEGLVMLLTADFKRYSELYGRRTARQAIKEAYTRAFREGKDDGK